MIVVSMSEFDLHDRWDKLELTLPPHQERYSRPSEYLLGAVRAGLLTFEQALEMYICCIGIAVAI